MSQYFRWNFSKLCTKIIEAVLQHILSKKSTRLILLFCFFIYKILHEFFSSCTFYLCLVGTIVFFKLCAKLGMMNHKRLVSTHLVSIAVTEEREMVVVQMKTTSENTRKPWSNRKTISVKTNRFEMNMLAFVTLLSSIFFKIRK